MSAGDSVRIRAGDAEREAAAEQLREAHAQGRLRFDDFDARLGSAYGATYLDELAVLVVDLPSASPTPAPSLPRWGTARGRRLPPLLVLAVVATVLLAATGHPPLPLFWIGLWFLFGHRMRRTGRFTGRSMADPGRIVR